MRALERRGYLAGDRLPDAPQWRGNRKSAKELNEPKPLRGYRIKLTPEQIKLFWELKRQNVRMETIAEKLHVGIHRLYLEILK